MKKSFFLDLFLTPFVLFFLWVALSVVDVALNNNSTASHSAFNFFVLALGV
jgi:hypothetical protein